VDRAVTFGGAGRHARRCTIVVPIVDRGGTMSLSTDGRHGPWTEATVYVLVGAALVVLGVVLRTYILNWVVGPLFVVVAVGAVTALIERRRATP
jgi:hypothetical protein